MKRKVKVTIEKEYEIELRPEVLTREFVEEFESYMWKLDGDTLEEKLTDFCKYAGTQIALYDLDFLEGLGPIASVRTVEYKEKVGDKINLVWNDTYEDVETEIVND